MEGLPKARNVGVPDGWGEARVRTGEGSDSLRSSRVGVSGDRTCLLGVVGSGPAFVPVPPAAHAHGILCELMNSHCPSQNLGNLELL